MTMHPVPSRSVSVVDLGPVLTVVTVLLLASWAIAPAAAASPSRPGVPGPHPVSLLTGAHLEEPLVATRPTSPHEDRALARALTLYRAPRAVDDFGALTAFLAQYPHSGWRVALLTNLGLSYYHYGYFSKAIAAWEQAWREGKTVTEPRAKALVDRAVGELARMHARLGHADRLAALFAEIGDRPVTGPATEALTGAREGLWTMRHDSGVAYLCGPMALKHLLLAQQADLAQVRFLDTYRSGPHGVSLTEVAQLAQHAQAPYVPVFRDRAQPLPVPSIVHWKVGHFAAIVGEANGRVHIVDPTFGRDLWVTRRALDAETSGYFLAAAGARRAVGWRQVGTAEADQVRGMGFTNANKPNATTPQDDTANPGCCPPCPGGMCGYNILEMLVSLNLQDTPVGYDPPKGPSVKVTLTYNQREASQPANFSFFNVSPKWTLNWLTYIQDDPTLPGAAVTRYVAGGGSVDYTDYNSSTGAFAPEARDAAVLVRLAGSPITYQRELADGSVEVYAQADGSPSFPRRVFLTQLLDPLGNAVTLHYDDQLRLTTLTDATGRNTTFSYGLDSAPLLVTGITDPFDRSAQLAYDGSGRLSQIIDVLGLPSQFTYNASGLITAMTTPYGTTSFLFGDNGNARFLQATDPLGNTEREEYLQGAPSIPFSDPPQTVPSGIIGPFNAFLTGRNSFHWDKHAYQVAGCTPAGGCDYTQARIKHWTHLASDLNVTADTIESLKYPLENRIWFNYPGQPAQVGIVTSTGLSGTFDRPSRIGRVLDDGTTQLTQISYNSAGRVTQRIDPVGRQIDFVYASNQIDLLQVQQQTGSGMATLATYTYNSQHRPLTSTDAAGQTTTYAYNSAGQLTQSTNPLGQTTTYEYDNLGNLIRIVNANNQTAASFTYDVFGCVATRTDSLGYTVSYAYDALDRLTQQTYPDGTTRQYTYAKLDLVAVTDRLGRVTHYTYDAVRNLVAMTDPLGHQTQYGHYENGRPKSLTDPNGHTTTWDIDVESRVTAKHYADGTQLAYTYEATASRLHALTDALGQGQHNGYTVDNRLAGITYVNALHPTPSASFTYDPDFPRLVSMTDGTGTTTYTYNPITHPPTLGAGRLAVITGAQDDTITYQYDALGRSVQRAIDGAVSHQHFDALGRVVSEKNALDTFAFQYLGESPLLAHVQSSRGLSSDYDYFDNREDRRLRRITQSFGSSDHQKADSPNEEDGGLLASFEYAYDAEGEATLMVVSHQFKPPERHHIDYDAAGRLIAVQTAGDGEDDSEDDSKDIRDQFLYAYDPAANRTSETINGTSTQFSYNAVNELVAPGPASYDAAGEPLTLGNATFTWDAAHRLLAVTSGGNTTRFAYDGFGRRTRITHQTGNTVTSDKFYVWCGRTPCLETDATTHTVTKRYFSEGVAQNGQPFYYTLDRLGSVHQLVDQSGVVRASYEYEPFGVRTTLIGDEDSDFGFARLFHDAQSGLDLAVYRAYDASLGRWLSRDPIGENGGMNLYSYVRNNPLGVIDPLGLGPPGGAPINPLQNLDTNATDTNTGGQGPAPTPAPGTLSGHVEMNVINTDGQSNDGQPNAPNIPLNPSVPDTSGFQTNPDPNVYPNPVQQPEPVQQPKTPAIWDPSDKSEEVPSNTLYPGPDGSLWMNGKPYPPPKSCGPPEAV